MVGRRRRPKVVDMGWSQKAVDRSLILRVVDIHLLSLRYFEDNLRMAVVAVAVGNRLRQHHRHHTDSLVAGLLADTVALERIHSELGVAGDIHLHRLLACR